MVGEEVVVGIRVVGEVVGIRVVGEVVGIRVVGEVVEGRGWVAADARVVVGEGVGGWEVVEGSAGVGGLVNGRG